MKNVLDDDYLLNELHIATKKDRAINYFIDFFVRLVLFLIYLGIYIEFFSTDHPLLYSRFWDHVFPFLMWYFISFFTYFLFECFNKGKTLGKVITKTKVVDPSRKDLTYRACFFRSLVRLIPFEGLVYLFINECPHDKYSSTIVISTS